eukprot:CAMPEP_0117479230 /NCGR_PEP_ID=MMETSP0784-20121206/11775_1 /TAXON_ID=39447 /ORGANISM="" /LENGTH=30 /DNA_ID= /DNA_START= /DNA_END= /DNA_ORIENTATION=
MAWRLRLDAAASAVCTSSKNVALQCLRLGA